MRLAFGLFLEKDIIRSAFCFLSLVVAAPIKVKYATRRIICVFIATTPCELSCGHDLFLFDDDIACRLHINAIIHFLTSSSIIRFYMDYKN